MAPEPSEALTELNTYTLDDFNTDFNAYNLSLGDETTRKRLRDKIVVKIRDQVLAHYNKYSTDSFTEQGWTNTILDSATIGLTAAGALEPGVALKNIILQTTGALTGARSSYQKNFFAENTPKLLRLRNVALMTSKKAIIDGFLDVPDSKFDLDRFAELLTDYYNASTVQAAFDDINADSGVKSAEAASLSDTQLREQAISLGLQEKITDASQKLASGTFALIRKATPEQAAAVLAKIPEAKRTDSTTKTAVDDLVNYWRSLDAANTDTNKDKVIMLNSILKDTVK